MTETAKPKIEKYLTDQAEIQKINIEKELDVEGVKKQLATFEDVTKKNIAKLGLLDTSNILSLNQAKDKTVEELVKMSTDNLKKIIDESKTATNETISKELTDAKLKVAELNTALEAKEAEVAEKIKTVESEYAQKEYFKDASIMYLEKAKDANWILEKNEENKEAIDGLFHTVKERLDQKYRFDTKTKAATYADGKPVIINEKDVLRTFDEIWEFEAKPFLAKSNGADKSGIQFNKNEPEDGHYNKFHKESGIDSKFAKDEAHAKALAGK